VAGGAPCGLARGRVTVPFEHGVARVVGVPAAVRHHGIDPATARVDDKESFHG